jgi:hypothetical protein
MAAARANAVTSFCLEIAERQYPDTVARVPIPPLASKAKIFDAKEVVVLRHARDARRPSERGQTPATTSDYKIAIEIRSRSALSGN